MILANYPTGVGVFSPSVNCTPSSIFSNKSTIGSRRDHYRLIFVHFLQSPWVRFPMFIMQVRDEPCQFAAGVIDVCLALNLEVFFIERTRDLLLEDIFYVKHLAPLVQLSHMLLDRPWNFRCSCIWWYWIRLWKTGQVLNFFPSDCSVCIWLHCQTKDTRMSST